MGRFAPLLLVSSIAACAGSQAAAPRAARAETLVTLEKIAVGCGLPRRALSLNEAGDIRFRPSPETPYEAVDCALVQLRARGLAGRMPMGFVGHESPEEGDGNHASPN